MVWIIGLVIMFIFYVAKSVEKQNAEEQKRRQERGRRSGTAQPQIQRTVQQRSERDRTMNRKSDPVTEQASADIPAENVFMKQYYETKKRIDQSSGKKAADSMRDTPRTSISGNFGTGWSRNQDSLRQAFVFSECVGKPRAVQPHPFFVKNRIR
ncbi:hypothetical protein NIE88_11200 [Sporolactobacillus shoreicorticis]|uniref:Uncharacterized protein n=1 Tax=Sporolactobacillus shoreicorticis TaxID=1923877 RepID=A0ABW5S5A3_9BACL|nr:hypothetical protein [Sporolactobacillus shoreicorticis]MCO7126336.1 hypothetical protein [Sporolactobacillus shoreicorticis]